MEEILELDKKLLLYLNSFHAPWLDPIMLFLTHTWVWLPLYFFLLYLVIREYKKECWIPLLGIVVTILLADQITSGFMKPYFARLRPSREVSLEGVLHLVRTASGDLYRGGMFSFASSHAANTLGTATFFFLLFRHSKKWIGWLFLWAVVMTYTRIYLGVHYPGDILVGGLIGILSGWFGFTLQRRIRKRYEQRKALQGS